MVLIEIFTTRSPQRSGLAISCIANYQLLNLRIHRVGNDAPDGTAEISDSNFAMSDCRQALASLADSGGKGRLHSSYTRQRSSSGDTSHTDNDRVDSNHGCYMSSPIDAHKPVDWPLVVELAKVTNTPQRHWQKILPVHTYTTSFFPPRY